MVVFLCLPLHWQPRRREKRVAAAALGSGGWSEVNGFVVEAAPDWCGSPAHCFLEAFDSSSQDPGEGSAPPLVVLFLLPPSFAGTGHAVKILNYVVRGRPC